MSDEAVNQRVVLQVEAPPIQGDTLANTRKQLEDIEMYLDLIRGHFRGLSKTPIVPVNFDQFHEKIKDLGKTVGNTLKPKDLFEQMFSTKGLRQAANDYLAEWKKQFARIEIEGRQMNSMRGTAFNTPKTAAAFFASFNQFQRDNAAQQAKAFSQFIGGKINANPTPQEVRATADGIRVLLGEGAIPPLVVPANRISVVLGAGEIAVAGGARPASATDTPSKIVKDWLEEQKGGASVPKSKRKKGAAKPLIEEDDESAGNGSAYRNAVEKLKADLEQQLRAAVTRSPAANKSAMSLYYEGMANGQEALLATHRDSLGESASLREAARIEKYRRQAEVQRLAAERARNAGSFGMLKRGDQDQKAESDAATAEQRKMDKWFRTARLRAIRQEEEEFARAQRSMRSSPQRYATTVERQRREAEEARLQARMAAATGQQLRVAGLSAEHAFDEYLTQGYKVTGRRVRQGVGPGGNQTHEVFTAEKVENGQRFATVLTKVSENGRVASVDISNTAKAVTKMGDDFVGSWLKVARWSANVAMLYGPLQLVGGAMKRTVDLSRQMGELENVFSGIGGSANELTHDIMGLASAQNRSVQESMGAAKAWASLGLNRAGVKAGTEKSLMLANMTGEGDATASAEKLIEVFKAYKMQVGELGPVLAIVTNLSKSFHLEQGAILDGLARSAPIARQYKMSIGEMSGHIATLSSALGISGVAAGNAMNGLATGFAGVDTQRELRQQFGVNLAPSGELREFSDQIAELYKRYKQLTRTEQDHLIMTAAGKNGFSRMAAVLDHYIESQVLAINAQLRLNVAEEQSAQVRKSLASQLQGLSTEFDRFVALQGEHGPVQALNAITEAMKNLLKVMNTPAGSWATTGALGLITVMGARLSATKVGVGEEVQRSGYWSRGLQRIDDAAKHVQSQMGYMVEDFGKSGRIGRINQSVYGFGENLFTSGRQNISAAKYAPNGVGGMVGGAVQRGVGVGQMMVGGAAGLAAGGMAALAPVALEIAVVAAGATAVIWGFNRAMEAIGQTSEHADKQLEGFSERIAKFESRAAAAAQAAKLFRTVESTMRSSSKEDNSRTLDLLSSLDGELALKPSERSAIEKALAEGKPIQSILGGAEDRAITENAVARQKAYVEALNQEKAIEEELARLRKAFWPSQEEIAKKQLQREQARNKALHLNAEMGSGQAAEDVVGTDSIRTQALTGVKVVGEALSHIFSSMAGGDVLTRYEAQTAALRAHSNELQSQMSQENDRRKELGKDHDESVLRANKLAASLRAQAAQLEESRTQNSAEEHVGPSEEEQQLQRDAARVEDRAKHTRASAEIERSDAKRKVLSAEQAKTNEEITGRESGRVGVVNASDIEASQQKARLQFQSYGIGYTESEKIADRIAKLEEYRNQKLREAAELKGMSLEKAQAEAQAIEAQKAIVDSMVQAEQRRFDLARQYGQMMKDREKEFSKSLLLADNNELLQRLGVARIAGGKMNSEMFMGLGAQGRRLWMDMPGNSFEAREMRREMALNRTPRDFRSESLRQGAMIGQMSKDMPAISNPQQQAWSEIIKTATVFNEQIKAAGAEVAMQLLRGSAALDKVVNHLEAVVSKLPYGGGSGGGLHLPQAGGYSAGGGKP